MNLFETYLTTLFVKRDATASTTRELMAAFHLRSPRRR